MRAAEITARRKALHLKQVDVASALNVSQGTVSNWERGKSVPSRTERARIREFFESSAGNSTHASVPPLRATPMHESFGEWVVQGRVAKGWTQAQLAKKAKLSQAAISNIEIGRSPNPLVATRLRIEEALGARIPAAIAEEQERAAEVEGVGVMLNFDPHDPKEYPTEAGVYVFYDRSDRPVYVGESTDIRRRVRDHADKFWFKAPIVDTASYVPIPDDALRRKVESVLIAFLRSNAVLNVRGTGRLTD